ncbi:MAG TPA: asparagine synthase-related protein, partial [Pyrinomonadaceae bacterium]|nr:asparagine synthase-related protein [Pyrinomonadaceae bacterium]
PMINDLLSEETVRRRGLFKYEQIRKIIDANESGKEDYNLQVFQLLNLEIWMKEFLDAKK